MRRSYHQTYQARPPSSTTAHDSSSNNNNRMSQSLWHEFIAGSGRVHVHQRNLRFLRAEQSRAAPISPHLRRDAHSHKSIVANAAHAHPALHDLSSRKCPCCFNIYLHTFCRRVAHEAHTRNPYNTNASAHRRHRSAPISAHGPLSVHISARLWHICCQRIIAFVHRAAFPWLLFAMAAKRSYGSLAGYVLCCCCCCSRRPTEYSSNSRHSSALARHRVPRIRPPTRSALVQSATRSTN